MSNESSASIERFRQALDRREDERVQLRDRIARSGSAREYIDITRANASDGMQTLSNIGYSSLKRRR
jgi:hypothetical protein